MRPIRPVPFAILAAALLACAAITPPAASANVESAAVTSAAAVSAQPAAAPEALPALPTPAVRVVKRGAAPVAPVPAAVQLEAEQLPVPVVQAAASPTPAAAAPDPESDLVGYAVSLYKAVQGRQWVLLVALLVVGLVAAARRFGVRWIPWLATKAGGIVLALVGGVAGTLALALGTGGAFSASLIVDGIVAGLTAAGLYDARKLVKRQARAPYVPPTGPRISPLSAA